MSALSQTWWLRTKDQKSRKQCLSDSCFALNRLISGYFCTSSSLILDVPVNFCPMMSHLVHSPVSSFPLLQRLLKNNKIWTNTFVLLLNLSSLFSTPVPSFCWQDKGWRAWSSDFHAAFLLFSPWWELGLFFCFQIRNLTPLVYFPTEWNTFGQATCVRSRRMVCVGPTCGLCFSKLSAATLKFWYKPFFHVQV